MAYPSPPIFYIMAGDDSKEVHVLGNIHFNKEDFEVFSIQGLDERMAGIRENVQPKFRYFAGKAVDFLQGELAGTDLPIHIAKHLRRTKYAPDNTWCAIGGDNERLQKIPSFPNSDFRGRRRFLFVSDRSATEGKRDGETIAGEHPSVGDIAR